MVLCNKVIFLKIRYLRVFIESHSTVPTRRHAFTKYMYMYIVREYHMHNTTGTFIQSEDSS